MSGVLLKHANRPVRLWAAAKMLPPPYQGVQILHSPCDTETLISMSKADKATRPFYNCMPVAHTESASVEQFNARRDEVLNAAPARSITFEAAAEKLRDATNRAKAVCAVVNLAKQQDEQFALYSDALRRINKATQHEQAGMQFAPWFSNEHVAGVVAFCLADLNYKALLDVLAFPTREGHKYSLSIVDDKDKGTIGTRLINMGVEFTEVPDTSCYGPLIIPSKDNHPAFMVFDRTAGLRDRGTALYVNHAHLPQLALGIGQSYVATFRDPAELALHSQVAEMRKQQRASAKRDIEEERPVVRNTDLKSKHLVS